MDRSEKIHVVISVYNGWEHTKECLDALRKSQYQLLETIVVDHGSTDATKIELSTKYPEVIRVSGAPSMWWAGATNLGIQTALQRGAELIMLLNNDSYVTPETIGVLITQKAELADPAIIAPSQKSLQNDNILFRSATTCFLLGFPTLILPESLGRRPNRSGIIPTKLIQGGRGALIPASIFRRVGLLDEETFPHYGADHDFYLRCLKQHIPLFVSAKAFVYVDDTKTTLASNLDKLGFKEFMATFFERRSHKNLTDLTALFKRYYPIKGLHYLGVSLNLVRYTLLYVWKRFTSLLGSHPVS
jgi:GT2 family glycosyltransferase